MSDPSASQPSGAASAGVTGGSAGSWSDRFEQGLHPAIERFNASIGFDITLLQEDLDGSIAHARMLGGCGVIGQSEADQLIEGLETIRCEAADGRFNPGLEAEDVHFAVERRLIELLGPLGKKLHTGRSRNDQVGTDLRLWLRRRIDDIDTALLRFERALLDQAERHAEVLIPGYTHLQRAQPICLAHHLLAYIEMAERDRQRFADARLRCPLCQQSRCGERPRFRRGVHGGRQPGDGAPQPPERGGDPLGH
jgi:argininosuccinate lyase